MVQFIKNEESGEDYMQVFSFAFTAEEAFRTFDKAKELNLDVCIDDKLLGNDWSARQAIEEHFRVSYTTEP